MKEGGILALSNFAEVLEKTKNQESVSRVVIAAAGDKQSIQAVFAAKDQKLVEPILVGDRQEIERIFKDLDLNFPEPVNILDIKDPKEASERAVNLIRNGEADFLMKGAVDSKTYLGAVVDKEEGLSTGKLMSHFSILEIPGYHKLIAPVDGGMVPYPDLNQKKQIILNSIGVFHRLEYKKPRVAVLACTEKVNPKMPETVDAKALSNMNKIGDITDCIVEGPISYDCAMSPEIALAKGYESQVSGDVDILVAPDIHAGNIMGKILTVTCKAKMAGIIVGASCPIVMTSRASSFEEKLLSLALASLLSKTN